METSQEVTIGSSMFSFFGKPRANITSTITFDEAYCHSAGAASGTRTYEIRRGTTEIIFAFQDFNEFIGTYLLNNPYFPEAIKRSVQQGTGVFCAQVVQEGLYLCTEGVSADGNIILRAQSLKPLKGARRLREFSSGAIAFGISERNRSALQFHVLWATMYKATKIEPAL